jgi:hypothetical protein
MWPFSLYLLAASPIWRMLLSVLVLDLLGGGILLLLSFFGTSIEAEYQVECGIL